MKSFQQFITEAKYHGDSVGRVTSSELDDVKRSKRADTPLKVGRIGDNRKKSSAEKKRVKAVGGGKTVETGGYKKRKDAGKQKPRSSREQQPTKERGSASLSPREQQRKARAERLAGKSGGKTVGKSKTDKTELKKAANKLLRKKKEAHPDYKPQKASGYTAHERRKISRAGERLVKDIRKGKEKSASHYDPKK